MQHCLGWSWIKEGFQSQLEFTTSCEEVRELRETGVFSNSETECKAVGKSDKTWVEVNYRSFARHLVARDDSNSQSSGSAISGAFAVVRHPESIPVREESCGAAAE